MQKAHVPLPHHATVTIEVSRGTFVKRDAAGHIDLLSPVPAPFNYGRAEGICGGDGEPRDVVVLGATLPRGTQLHVPVRGVVRFVDGGQEDDKWVCSPRPPSRAELWQVQAFFRFYARLKRVRDRLRGQPATSRFGGWQSATPA